MIELRVRNAKSSVEFRIFMFRWDPRVLERQITSALGRRTRDHYLMVSLHHRGLSTRLMTYQRGVPLGQALSGLVLKKRALLSQSLGLAKQLSQDTQILRLLAEPVIPHYWVQ